jgi:serine/threonine-protein kinase RIO1
LRSIRELPDLVLGHDPTHPTIFQGIPQSRWPLQRVPNQPYLDSSVHWRIRSGLAETKEPRYDESVEAICDSGLATEVIRRIGSGKEADVYLCRDDRELVAVKAYRLYRTSHRGGSAMRLDSMGHRASREYELLVYAARNRVQVPEPRRREENMFSMEFLGNGDTPAPLLRHADLARPAEFLKETLQEVVRLADAGIVHTDLSPFNILAHRDRPWIIDLASCVRVDRLGESPWVRATEASSALRRGLAALARYFSRYGLAPDIESVANEIMAKVDRFGVLE